MPNAPDHHPHDHPLGLTVYDLPSPQDVATADERRTNRGRWRMLMVLQFGFVFDDGQIIVRYCDNFHDDKGIQNWKGEDIYLFQDNNGYTQWVHPSQVEVV